MFVYSQQALECPERRVFPEELLSMLQSPAYVKVQVLHKVVEVVFLWILLFVGFHGSRIV